MATQLPQLDLETLEVWIPEQMEPGTIFMLESPMEEGDRNNPYIAVLACPRCGSIGLITKYQKLGLNAMICGSDACSVEYYIHDETLKFRAPQ